MQQSHELNRFVKSKRIFADTQPIYSAVCFYLDGGKAPIVELILFVDLQMKTDLVQMENVYESNRQLKNSCVLLLWWLLLFVCVKALRSFGDARKDGDNRFEEILSLSFLFFFLLLKK